MRDMKIRRPDSMPTRAAAPSAVRRLTPPIAASVDQLILVASAYWSLALNRGLLQAAIRQRGVDDLAAWGFLGAMLLIVFLVHLLLLAALAHRRTVKPLLVALTVAAAVGAHFVEAFGVVLDPTMLRNAWRTDLAEARELLSPALLLDTALLGGLPLALLARTRIVDRPWRRALRARLLLGVVALLALIGTVWSVYQPLSSWMRQQREVRYLITPANLVWSAASVLVSDARSAARPRQPIGTDAVAGPSWAARTRPTVLVLVVGETVRAANWGLAGYARQTTPQLARLPVVGFNPVESCGTNTETSLPCMFAPVGRRDYDEARIRGSESLLHVLARAGAGVHWRDNQSGCKGVCDGLPTQTVTGTDAPGLCEGERCLDEALIADLDRRLEGATGTQVWVLHMLGNHGPSYFRRHPSGFAPFQPECRDDDLRRCSVDEIVNAYDNAVAYTDHVLSTAIARLQRRAGQVDSALLFVSDHGESLGEHGLFLHGLPYRIAPREQTRVPMLWWSSPGFDRAAGLREGCLLPELRRRAAEQLSHDHLFHTVLGVLDVRTALREPALDLSSGCRAG
ncbi:MAG: hypothetical protein RIS35_100 [Pseudomonadota bacterium]